MWVDSPEVFISAEMWNKNSHGFSVDILAFKDCYAGLEIGASGDISALVLLFPGEVVKLKSMYFISEDALKINEFYRDNKHLIRVDPGNEVENEVAIKWIEEEFTKYNLHSFCFPNTHKNNSIVQGLIKLGYQGNPISQGTQSISDATEEWEKLLRSGSMEHFNDPILRYMNSNCLVVRKETGTRLTKSGKVLGIYAGINAIAQWKTIAATEGSDQLIESW
jgi:phage terminase large subunit-like protein